MRKLRLTEHVTFSLQIGSLRSHRLVTAWGLEVMEGRTGQ